MTIGKPMPFAEAIENIASRRLLPNDMSSAELSTLDAAIRRRALFSARVTQVRDLQLMQRLIGQVAGGLREDGTVAGDGESESPMMSIAEAKAQLRELRLRLGYRAPEGAEGGIRDLTSDARLQLQIETNVLDAQSYGRWRRAQTEDALGDLPGWELVRMGNFGGRHRNWAARFRMAGAASGRSDGWAIVGGRMVALQNHPIWQALGDGAGGFADTLGNPWPPFAFNSGMNVIDLDASECRELGILTDDNQPVPDVRPLPDDLEAGAAGIDGALLDALSQSEDLELRDGVLRMKGGRS
jgi:hypothetical protein